MGSLAYLNVFEPRHHLKLWLRGGDFRRLNVHVVVRRQSTATGKLPSCLLYMHSFSLTPARYGCMLSDSWCCPTHDAAQGAARLGVARLMAAAPVQQKSELACSPTTPRVCKHLVILEHSTRRPERKRSAWMLRRMASQRRPTPSKDRHPLYLFPRFSTNWIACMPYCKGFTPNGAKRTPFKRRSKASPPPNFVSCM